MKALVALTLLAVPLLGCTEYQKPIAQHPYGYAVRHNMEAQIIPVPPATKPPVTSGARQAQAYERYSTDKAEQPGSVTTTGGASGG